MEWFLCHYFKSKTHCFEIKALKIVCAQKNKCCTWNSKIRAIQTIFTWEKFFLLHSRRIRTPGYKCATKATNHRHGHEGWCWLVRNSFNRSYRTTSWLKEFLNQSASIFMSMSVIGSFCATFVITFWLHIFFSFKSKIVFEDKMCFKFCTQFCECYVWKNGTKMNLQVDASQWRVRVSQICIFFKHIYFFICS